MAVFLFLLKLNKINQSLTFLVFVELLSRLAFSLKRKINEYEEKLWGGRQKLKWTTNSAGKVTVGPIHEKKLQGYPQPQ